MRSIVINVELISSAQCMLYTDLMNLQISLYLFY